jgi:predicted ATPase
MMIHRLKVCGLLSFGPIGIDLPLQPLNVLIGPNGAGKSNLLEVLALLRAAPAFLPRPIKETGGIGEWLWQGPGASGAAVVDAVIDWPAGPLPLRHRLEFGSHGERFELTDERIESDPTDGQDTEGDFVYRFQRGRPVLNAVGAPPRELRRESLSPEESILSQVRFPEWYPALDWLQDQYPRICLYRSWTFGPAAQVRRPPDVQGRGDVLTDGGENLALVLASIRTRAKRDLIESLQRLYEGVEDLHVVVEAGQVRFFVEERGGRLIPASRLSDGTLRYLGLLAVLLHPDPPPLVAIEEPELGLHPDLIPHLADLLVGAAGSMQLIVTTHSRLLIDALTERPESVVVCEQRAGGSYFERLDPVAMSAWLDRYCLGDLWSRGEIGGNRW